MLETVFTRCGCQNRKKPILEPNTVGINRMQHYMPGSEPPGCLRAMALGNRQSSNQTVSHSFQPRVFEAACEGTSNAFMNYLHGEMGVCDRSTYVFGMRSMGQHLPTTTVTN